VTVIGNIKSLLSDGVRLGFLKYDNQFEGTQPSAVIKSSLWHQQAGELPLDKDGHHRFVRVG
jgi:hypothetical protein